MAACGQQIGMAYMQQCLQWLSEWRASCEVHLRKRSELAALTQLRNMRQHMLAMIKLSQRLLLEAHVLPAQVARQSMH